MPVPDATAGGASPPESANKKARRDDTDLSNLPPQIGGYKILRDLGAGSFGRVCLATD